MSASPNVISLRFVSRAALTGLAGLWLAGCSADSSRISEGFASPFSNPFAGGTADAAAPTPSVDVRPLALNSGPMAAAANPAPVAVAAIPAAPIPGQTRMASAPAGAVKGWSAVGGSPVIVGDSETLETLSRRYGVPSAALLNANGLNNATQIHGGVRLIIPVYNSAFAASDAPVLHKPKAIAVSANAPSANADGKKTKKPADAIQEADATVDAPIATAKAKTKTSVADAAAPAHSLKPPLASVAAAAAPLAPAPAPIATKAAKTAAPVEIAGAAKKGGKTELDKTATASLGTSTAAKSEPVTSAQADATGANPEFRWPARGRIIEGFKVGANDGINISVPEGTSVRAAESGVVAYSGDGLKGYGNLVLIRHPNGYVTAYANNGALSVKSGETVKRGQIIATSGQTGNVSAPQLHFELRKGKTPVDPTSYLAGL